MLPISLYTHRKIFRWDLLTKFCPKNVYVTPELKQIHLRMHESRPQNYKDRFVLALILETLGMQRLSNRMILKNRYKKALTVKRNSNEIGIQLSLRKFGLYRFVDTFFLNVFPQSNSISQYRSLLTSTRGDCSLYYEELTSFPGVQRLSAMIHGMPSLQIHLSGAFLNNRSLEYLLASLRFLQNNEASLVSTSTISYSFFNK